MGQDLVPFLFSTWVISLRPFRVWTPRLANQWTNLLTDGFSPTLLWAVHSGHLHFVPHGPWCHKWGPAVVKAGTVITYSQIFFLQLWTLAHPLVNPTQNCSYLIYIAYIFRIFFQHCIVNCFYVYFFILFVIVIHQSIKGKGKSPISFDVSFGMWVFSECYEPLTLAGKLELSDSLCLACTYLLRMNGTKKNLPSLWIRV